jgi:hypothetical protein
MFTRTPYYQNHEAQPQDHSVYSCVANDDRLNRGKDHIKITALQSFYAHERHQRFTGIFGSLDASIHTLISGCEGIDVL